LGAQAAWLFTLELLGNYSSSAFWEEEMAFAKVQTQEVMEEVTSRCFAPEAW
jgi:hypothetical protein